MKKSFILFSSNPESLKRIRSFSFVSDFDVLVSYDMVSLCSIIFNHNLNPSCIFFDISCGKINPSILNLCAENNIVSYYFDSSVNLIQNQIRKIIGGGAVSDDFFCGTDESPADSFFVGKSPEITKLKKKIILAAKTDIPILLTGENGTGKSLAAKVIHRLSKRNKKSFFDVNISAIPETLIESELFGNVRGAFTDAKDREGYFMAADGSSLFLDEIGEMSYSLQAKLLKVLDSKEFRKVGSDRIQKSDARIICATNADLKKKILLKEFREDLYYRIAVFEISVPPLRERKSDIPLLAEDFLRNRGKFLSNLAVELLKTCDWRGNIRQLHNCLERAVLFSQERDEILPRDIVF